MYNVYGWYYIWYILHYTFGYNHIWCKYFITFTVSITLPMRLFLLMQFTLYGSKRDEKRNHKMKFRFLPFEQPSVWYRHLISSCHPPSMQTDSSPICYFSNQIAHKSLNFLSLWKIDTYDGPVETRWAWHFVHIASSASDIAWKNNWTRANLAMILSLHKAACWFSHNSTSLVAKCTWSTSAESILSPTRK